MLRYAQDIGWEYVPPDEALRLRGGESGLYFTPMLERQLLRLNPTVVDETRCADILRQLNLLKPTIEGNRDALEWMRGEHSVFLPDENRERNVLLIDFEHPDRNVFHVTDEWRHKSTVFANRADVIFLVNGIPVALAETKGAGDRDGLTKGITQIRRYHRETPELLIAPQVFEVTELVHFYYAATWNTSRKNLFDWRDEVAGDYERKVKAFFDPTRFLRVLRDYIIFLQKDDQLSKVILRQHQTRAVQKVLNRVADPAKAKLTVALSADSRYLFWCNGTFIGRGPAKGDVNHHFYDSFDLTPHLRKGRNVLAALVLDMSRVAHRPALLGPRV